MRGGKRPGSGRPAGARNKKSVAIEAAADKGITPLAYMLSILRDEDQPANIRLDAAKDCAPYLHPKLSAAELSIREAEPSEEELYARLRAVTEGNPAVAAHLKNFLEKK